MYKNNVDFFKPWRTSAILYSVIYFMVNLGASRIFPQLEKSNPKSYAAIAAILSMPVFYLLFRAESGPNRKLIPEDDLPDDVKSYFSLWRGSLVRIFTNLVPLALVIAANILALTTFQIPSEFAIFLGVGVFSFAFMVNLSDWTIGYKYFVQIVRLGGKLETDYESSVFSKAGPQFLVSHSKMPSLVNMRLYFFRMIVSATMVFMGYRKIITGIDELGSMFWVPWIGLSLVFFGIIFKMHHKVKFYPPVEGLPQYLKRYVNWVARPTLFVLFEIFPSFLLLIFTLYFLNYRPLMFIVVYVMGVSILGLYLGVILELTLGRSLRSRHIRESKFYESSGNENKTKPQDPQST